MFYRTVEGVVGVLCDWDLSASKKAIGKEKPLAVDLEDQQAIKALYSNEKDADPANEDVARNSDSSLAPTAVEVRTEDKATVKRKARYRTGTGPFMALDLLAPGPAPVHIYRFDLESFFWVLIYFVAVHNPKRHTLGRIDQWADPNLAVVRDSKARFLRKFSVMQQVFNTMDPQYTAFHREVLVPLCFMFMKLQADAAPIDNLRNRLLLAETLKQKQEEKALSAEIVTACDNRNSLITFEKFMEKLEVEY